MCVHLRTSISNTIHSGKSRTFANEISIVYEVCARSFYLSSLFFCDFSFQISFYFVVDKSILVVHHNYSKVTVHINAITKEIL